MAGTIADHATTHTSSHKSWTFFIRSLKNVAGEESKIYSFYTQNLGPKMALQAAERTDISSFYCAY